MEFCVFVSQAQLFVSFAPDRRVCLQQLKFDLLVCVCGFCLFRIYDFNITGYRPSLQKIIK